MGAGGRPKKGEWDEFTVIREKTGERIALVVCNHCIRHHREQNGPEPDEIQGRLDRLVNHLRNCAAYQKRNQAHASTPLVDLFVTPRKRKNDSSRATPSPAKRQKRTWTKSQKDHLNCSTARMQASLGLPDTFVSNQEFLDFVEELSPGSSNVLLRPKALGRFVEEYAHDLFLRAKKELKEHQTWTRGRVNLLSDGWENRSRIHLLGYQLSLHGHVLTLSLDEVGTSHNGVAVAKLLERIIVKAKEDGWEIGGVITDDAGQCARARRILTLRWPTLAFGKCFAHDVNNLVKSILNTSFKQIATQAASLVRQLIGSSAKWLPRVQEEIERMCGVKLAFYTLCDTRWNSMQACFASLLRAKTALENFWENFERDPEFPVVFRVFNDKRFWTKLIAAEVAIHPLAEASYKLQRDNNTLADVVEMYEKIYRGFVQNARYGTELVGCIEQRWRKCEHPLLLLAYFLHPKRAGCEKEFPQSLCAAVSHFCFYYYRKFIEDTHEAPGTICSDFSEYIAGRLTKSRAPQFNSVFEYWKQVDNEKSANGKSCKLAKLALVVLSIGANTAPCERMFSDLGVIHTAVRNRMSYQKALAFHRVRQDIFMARKKNDAKQKTIPNRIVDPRDRRTMDGGRSEHQEEYEEAVSVEETFVFWQGVLAEVMEDDVIEDDYNSHHPPTQIDPYEQIEKVDREEFPLPENEEEAVRQDKMEGLRAWKISLQELFRIQNDNNENESDIVV